MSKAIKGYNSMSFNGVKIVDVTIHVKTEDEKMLITTFIKYVI